MYKNKIERKKIDGGKWTTKVNMFNAWKSQPTTTQWSVGGLCWFLISAENDDLWLMIIFHPYWSEPLIVSDLLILGSQIFALCTL